MTYVADVKTTKKFTGNVVIKVGTNYFAIRQPDSGLTIASPNDKLVTSLVLNPTTIDVRKVTTTISSFSFTLLDKNNAISALVLGDAVNLIGQQVRIYLGRSNVGMDFADYFELPLTYVRKCDHKDNSYTFSSTEQTERMQRPIYSTASALGAAIVSITTVLQMRDDISAFPAAGLLKIDSEYMSYTSKNNTTKQFLGVVRGELNSVPAAHNIYAAATLAETVQDNPLNIILKLLISGGGGGTYDTLKSGLGISNTLVDIAEIEALRDSQFIGQTFKLTFSNVTSALKEIEADLLAPNNLRFSYSVNSKLTLALLDKAYFVEEIDVIDENTMTTFPTWTLDGQKVTNSIEVQWDYNEGTNTFQQKTVYSDATSISTYGASTPLKFDFKGIKAALSGQILVDDFGSKMLARLAYPTPEISFNTHLDKSLQNIGAKAYVKSSKIPAADGTLNFASDLEIISRSINQTTGDVAFKVAFTSYTNIRSAFIAPSDLALSASQTNSANIALGRGTLYTIGWYMRLWDEVLQSYTADAPNPITRIDIGSTYLLAQDGSRLTAELGDLLQLNQASTEDTLYFLNNWVTNIAAAPSRYRLKFADYDDAIASQKRYGFLSAAGANFSDGGQTYKVTY